MFKTVSLAIVLSLTILTPFPTAVTPVAGLTQSQNQLTTWSPFGPREKNQTITVYSDILNELNAFGAGHVDITDFPLLPSSLGLCSSNPDFYCTNQTSLGDIFELDINHYASFLGASMQTNRTAPPPTILLPVSTGPTSCGTGFGQLTIHLLNQEDGNSTILDSLNRLTIANQPSGSPSATVADQGGTTPTGTYVFPCILAGSYKVSSSIYGSSSPCTVTIPTNCLSIPSGQLTSATFLVDWNSPSTRKPTQAGIYIPRALAHLLDKPAFVSSFFGSTAVSDNEFITPNNGIPNLFNNTAECVDHPWFNLCNPVSAYNFVSDNIAGGSEWWTQFGANIGVGPGYSGVADLRAACDDFVKAGFQVINGANSTDCGDVALASLGSTAPSTYPHLSNNGRSIVFLIRTSVGRKQFGTILGDTIDFLFGTPSNTGGGTVNFGPPPTPVPFIRYYTISPVAQCVFADGGNPDCWNLYTAGWTSLEDPEYLYFLAHSSLASSICGGQFAIQPSENYPFFCDPKFDTFAGDGESSISITQAIQLFARAAQTAAYDGLNVPVYTPVSQFIELNGWSFQQCTGSTCAPTQSSLVNTLDHGIDIGNDYWTLLNVRQVPGYTPANSIYLPGGGNPNLVRRGFSESTFNLSPFTAGSNWDTDIVGQIYDSLLHLNPLTAFGNAQVVDWQTTSHSSTFNPTLSCTSPATGPVTGCTVQLWHLRNDLYFQDGTPVTANDIAYTLLAYRDVPSSMYGAQVSSISSAAGLDCGPGQPCKTVQVVLAQQNPFNEINVGTVPIIPEHIWEPICGPIVSNAIPSGSTSPCASYTFDPMALGIMIGDGPWECVVPTGFPNAGHVGGSCTIIRTAQCQDICLGGGEVDPGGTINLSRYQQFARCCPDDTSSSLYKVSWADKNNDGVVNIQDLASVASCFGLAAGSSNAICGSSQSSYWVNSNIASGPTVNISDLATVAFYFAHGTTYPYLPSQLTGLDPQIDPFFCPNTGC